MKNANASELKTHVGFWLRLVSNNVSYAFAARLASSGVTVAEWVILREMYGFEGSTAPSVLSESTGLTRGAISKLVERLVAKKLVSRKEQKVDRRFQQIILTKAGKDLVPKLAVLADQNDDEFFSSLNKMEKQNLKALLERIASANHLTHLPIE